MAINIINNLLNQSILPIIVGGTHYYMESLLFHKDNTSLTTNDLQTTTTTTIPTTTATASLPLPSVVINNNNNNEEEEEKSLHSKLQEIDSELASTLHPNDTRRIKKVLQQLNQEVMTHLIEIFFLSF